ncbi:hypothetical protein HOP50_03g19880 [Chloropicon primus]|uniref:Uncharacterized protein n=1 Tax=Chloropicon primus TaxID=1764295 RepID=A0A5B8MJE7_9CHLO|nr:hypothetical protein A3770_03p19900 [Chloropicon primus]UPQ98682.1 hypothetical protein HOP50_03g19880 [Chloropicon primus]|mmetsp:Transcript_5596/g.17027  ORF Transcript_5596/g.17027 Transcript_5596/m.17027 type:complete len:200 (+) Transcript_5596:136-735(+)|eukprot:QDZ19472.1 hypothetical protein A3770_03p19900 [Chloropicon primus]
MIPVCATTLSSFVWEQEETGNWKRGDQANKRSPTARSSKGSAPQGPQAPASALRKRQRQNPLVGKAGFGVVLVNGQVRVSTVIFTLCLLEAILWTSCLLSSSSALKTDTLEAEHYLVRETENLKSSLSSEVHKLVPAFQKSLETKQHIFTERLWAQRLRSTWSDIHLNWNTPLRENFQLEASILDKGIPGPFAGVQAIH